jgi:tetratricopeptide (TPR) repeat protein
MLKSTRDAQIAYGKVIKAADAGEFQVLPKDVRDKAREHANSQIKQMGDSKKYDDLIKEADAEVKKGNLFSAAALLEQALKVKPGTPGLAEKVKDLRYKHYLELARSYVQAVPPRLGEAETALQDALHFKDKGQAPEIVDLQAKIAQIRDYAALITQGDQQATAKHWDAAIALYTRARAVAPPDQVKVLDAKLADVKFTQALENAQAARASRDFAGARDWFGKAMTCKPASAPMIQAQLQAMATDQQYNDLIAAVKKAIEAHNWKEARDRLTEAKKIKATAECEQLDVEISYQQNFFSAKQAFEEKDYTSAKAYCNVARKYKSTPELDDLVKQIDDAAAKAAATGGAGGGS